MTLLRKNQSRRSRRAVCRLIIVVKEESGRRRSGETPLLLPPAERRVMGGSNAERIEKKKVQADIAIASNRAECDAAAICAASGQLKSCGANSRGALQRRSAWLAGETALRLFLRSRRRRGMAIGIMVLAMEKVRRDAAGGHHAVQEMVEREHAAAEEKDECQRKRNRASNQPCECDRRGAIHRRGSAWQIPCSCRH
jgi:hypothetical protein